MKIVYVGAGHGAGDPGAVGNNLVEAEYSVTIRNLIATELRRRGIEFRTDGEGSLNRSLREAIKIAQTCTGPKIEIHLNAAGSPSATGVESIALPAQKALAQKLSAAIAAVTGFRLRGEAGWIDQSKSARGRLGFLNQAGGVIVEVGFLSNPTDADILIEKSAEIARAIASVLADEVTQ